MNASCSLKSFPAFCFPTPGKLISRYPWDKFLSGFSVQTKGGLDTHSWVPSVPLVLLINCELSAASVVPSSSPSPSKSRSRDGVQSRT